MPRLVLTAALLAAFVAFAAGNRKLEDADLSADVFTVDRTDREAYSEPAPVLDARQRQAFLVGRNVFHRQWASIVSLNGDWGLGPTFVADRCSACHTRAGRGSPPAPGEQLLSLLVRISIPGTGAHGGPMPHPAYGDQLQNRALDGSHVDLAYAGAPVPPEAALYVDWETQVVLLDDGDAVELRSPKLRIEQLNFGPLGEDTMTSLRMASPVFGLGLLEAVAESTLLEVARAQKAQGYDGRLNYVWDPASGSLRPGRFGWKANQPSIRMQVATAAIGDMGLSSRYFPDQNCPPVQAVCARHLPGNFPEIINYEIDALELWMHGLAVPARRDMRDPEVRRGEALFAQAECAVCHVPEMKTGAFAPMKQLSHRTFRAYTDLLLHDMGEGLADGRPEFLAGPRDWRTAPLWGLGLSQVVSGSTALLHDGRARNVTEAILWHGGEALPAREAFRAMRRDEREALVRFVEAI